MIKYHALPFLSNTPTKARPITLCHVAANQPRSTTLLYVRVHPSHQVRNTTLHIHTINK